jgi:hypothetical protein
VSAIGHYLESAGLATASISLIREHTEVMQPPRALWVPFPLGRPLGVPHDAAFQTKVLQALLKLFERTSGPILEDFPDDAPPDPAWTSGDTQGEACPVFFDSPSPSEQSEELLAVLLNELNQLAPWHALSAKRRGASAFGLASQTSTTLARQLVALTQSSTTQPSDWHAAKLAVDDLRTFYEEAAASQPSPLPPAALSQWFYTRTQLGGLLKTLRQLGLSHEDPSARQIADRMLIPRKFHKQD